MCLWASGFACLWRGRSVSGLSLPPLHPLPALTTRTALVMPIYNEDPSRIFAGLQAIYESLDALGAMASFDFFILSDTTDPEVWLEEERGFYALRQRTAGDTHIFIAIAARIPGAKRATLPISANAGAPATSTW